MIIEIKKFFFLSIKFTISFTINERNEEKGSFVDTFG